MVACGDVKSPRFLPCSWLRDLFRFVLVLSRVAAVLVLVVARVVHVTRCNVRFVSVSDLRRFVVAVVGSTDGCWTRPW